MVYRFTEKSRQEVEAMLGLTLQETRFYQDAKEEGREEEGRSLIFRLLTRRFGALPETITTAVNRLPIDPLEELAEALLDFTAIDEVEQWLSTHNHTNWIHPLYRGKITVSGKGLPKTLH